jgi:hypothetical protein
MDVYSRRIIGFGVQAMTVDGPSLCWMFNQAKGGGVRQPSTSLAHYRWQSHCQGLFELPVAAGTTNSPPTANSATFPPILELWTGSMTTWRSALGIGQISAARCSDR